MVGSGGCNKLSQTEGLTQHMYLLTVLKAGGPRAGSAGLVSGEGFLPGLQADAILPCPQLMGEELSAVSS